MTVDIVPILLFVITLLLGTVGFFLRQLHTVIQNLTKSVSELQLALRDTRHESQREYDSLKLISEEHSKRLDSHARKIEKNTESILKFKPA